jgi:hypothetical protein
VPLILGLNLYGIPVNNPAFRRGSVHQLFAVLEWNAKSAIYLNTKKFRKIVYSNSFFYSICFVLWVNGIGRDFESTFNLCSRRNQLLFKGCEIAIFINNPSLNSWSRQFLINPYNTFICIGLLNLNKRMFWEPFIRTGISDFRDLVVIYSGVLLNVDYRKVPISQAVFGNKRFA